MRDLSKIFVGGIPSRTTEEDLRDHFEKYGSIKDVVLMKDRGFGFVTFTEVSSASEALGDTHNIDGASVDVKEAVRASDKGDRRRGGDDRGRGGGGDVDKIFVGGLPQDADDDKVREYFSIYGHVKDAVVMKDRETGRSRGFGFVQFESRDAVDKCMDEYSDHKIDGKWVEVKRCQPRGQVGDDRDRGRDDRRDDRRDAPPPGAPPPGPYGAYGAYPGYGGYPGYPGYPGYGAYGMPAYPMGYPGMPMMPGAPGGFPGGFPGYPGFPGMMPGMEGMEGMMPGEKKKKKKKKKKETSSDSASSRSRSRSRD